MAQPTDKEGGRLRWAAVRGLSYPSTYASNFAPPVSNYDNFRAERDRLTQAETSPLPRRATGGGAARRTSSSSSSSASCSSSSAAVAAAAAAAARNSSSSDAFKHWDPSIYFTSRAGEVCSYCRQVFETHRDVVKHARMLCPMKGDRFACGVCRKCFASEETLKGHRKQFGHWLPEGVDGSPAPSSPSPSPAPVDVRPARGMLEPLEPPVNIGPPATVGWTVNGRAAWHEHGHYGPPASY